MSEKEWQQTVVELATYTGWQHMHILNARGSDAGWPDLVLTRPPELLVAELKTDTGRLSPAQTEWLEVLAACGVETHVWRPRDFAQIHARLSHRRDRQEPD